jgi:hypothetical protein
MPRQAKTHLFRREQFPFVIQFVDVETGELVKAITVEAPVGLSTLRIPSFLPRVVRVVMRYANGDIEVADPEFECPRCGRRTPHPDDIRNRYCPSCHVFVEDGPDG